MSDSENDLEEGFTETSVLLGYAEEEPTGDEISHLGGEPVIPPRPATTALSDSYNSSGSPPPLRSMLDSPNAPAATSS